mmetsp:Transcript_123411/g.343757  ORF Transcript_123411/g.343757 Transcript_123411/m.343757 type:complete len:224 (-) Transcript_123411:90-761(-)
MSGGPSLPAMAPCARSGPLWKESSSGMCSLFRFHRKFLELKGGCLYWSAFGGRADSPESQTSKEWIDFSALPCKVMKVADNRLRFRLTPCDGSCWSEGVSPALAGTTQELVFDVSNSGNTRGSWVRWLREHIAYGQGLGLQQCSVPVAEGLLLALRLQTPAKLVVDPRRQLCPVCLDTLADGRPLAQTPCEHVFHAGCLVPWLRCFTSCPTCRASILKPEAES